MKKLTRNRDDKWVGGVCGGIATYTGVDANLIRLIVAVTTLLGAGSLFLAYLIAWLLMPVQPETVWAAASDSTTPVAPTTVTEPAPPSR